MNLDDMPLDTPEHIQLAWHLVTGMAWRRARERGESPVLFIPGEAELSAAMDRIRAAAGDYDISLTRAG